MVSHIILPDKMIVNACQLFQGIFRRKPKPCSSHRQPVLAYNPTCRSKKNRGRLSGTCENRMSSHTSSTLAHVGQPGEGSGTGPPRRIAREAVMRNPSYSLWVQRDTWGSIPAGT